MPQKTFDEQAFCTYLDIKDTIEDLGLVLMLDDSNESNIIERVEKKITLSKNRKLKFDLIKHLRTIYPTTMSKWIVYMRSQIASKLEGANRDYFLSGGDKIMPQGFSDSINNLQGYNGLGNFIIGTPAQDNINIFLFYGVPVSGSSGTLTGKAPMTNGSILLDTNRMDPKSVYINRGDTDFPIWQTFRADDAIDYILNPEVLINCQIYAALMMLQEDGLLRDRPNYQQKGFQADMKKMFEIAYDEAKNGTLSDDGKKRVNTGDLSLIDFDLSGDGTLSDWEQEQNEQAEGIRRFFF